MNATQLDTTIDLTLAKTANRGAQLSRAMLFDTGGTASMKKKKHSWAKVWAMLL